MLMLSRHGEKPAAVDRRSAYRGSTIAAVDEYLSTDGIIICLDQPNLLDAADPDRDLGDVG
jgi:hypothetical protein